MTKSDRNIYRGREFTTEEIELIKSILKQHPNASRTFQSKLICEKINWRQANGVLKDKARNVLLRIHNKGIIHCPPIRLTRRRRKNEKKSCKGALIFLAPKRRLMVL